MQTNGKIFSYPVLTDETVTNAYPGKFFKIVFEEEADESQYILKNLHFTCDSEYLMQKYRSGEIKIKCLIQCSASIYRQLIEIDETPRDYALALNDFSGVVTISLVAYTTHAQTLASSEEFDEDYRGITYRMAVHQLLATNSGYRKKIPHDIKRNSLAASIFSIIRLTNEDDPDYNITISKDRIEIALAGRIFDIYKDIHNIEGLSREFFSVLLIPALMEGLVTCQQHLEGEGLEDISDITDTYSWFSSVLRGYKSSRGRDLTKEEFKETHPHKLAQQLLGSPIEKTLKIISERGMEEEENEQSD